MAQTIRQERHERDGRRESRRAAQRDALEVSRAIFEQEHQEEPPVSAEQRAELLDALEDLMRDTRDSYSMWTLGD